MKIKLLTIGKTLTPFLREGEREYVGRVNRYAAMEQVTVPDIRSARSLTREQQKEQEGQQILAHVRPGDTLVLLDEHGQEFSSREFAAFVEKRLASGATRGLVFAVGGPYGFSQGVYGRADFKISLSRMTFSHEMVRMFFLEQLYRAFTILRGEPYHHD